MSDLRSAQFSDADPGLFSLSQIMHLMRTEFGRAQRYRYPLSVLVIGVDRLGSLRDVYGYESKEAVLDEVARLLKKETRSCDFLGRLADDRLMAVAPHTDSAGVDVLASRLLNGVRNLRFESNAKEIPVRISIGAASMTDQRTMYFDQLVAAAERALEEGSSAGGDRLAWRDPSEGAG